VLTRRSYSRIAPDAVTQALFHERERLTLAETLEQTRPRLASQLRYVAAASPFYARKWGAETTQAVAGASADTVEELLAELPPTRKDELRQAQEADPPFGDYLACPHEEVARVHRTSGTTGRPLLIALSASDAELTRSHGAQALWCAGLRPDDVVVHCLNYCMWSGGVTDHLCLEGTGAAVVPFGAGNTELLIALPRWLGFTAVSCTPSYVSLLLERLDGEDLHRWAENVRLFLVGGEPGGSSPAFKERVESTFGARLVDANYGLAEVLSIFASECPVEGGFHFHGQGALWVELLDPASDRRLLPEQGVTGELVLTHAARRAQPLVRYRTNDLLEIVSVGLCACGRDGLRFLLRGRADDMFVVRGVNVFPGAIADVLGRVSSDLREFVITLPDSDTYDYVPLRVEAADGTAHDLPETIAREVKTTLGCTARVEIVPPGTLPRSEGKVSRVQREGEATP
jgi:phenylacetate-CoA ligase